MLDDDTGGTTAMAVEGLALLLAAGRETRSRTKRRDLVRRASVLIAETSGRAPFYDAGVQDGPATARVPSAPTLPPTDAEAETWVAGVLALLPSTDDEAAPVLFRSVLRPLAGMLGAALGGASDDAAMARRIVRAAAGVAEPRGVLRTLAADLLAAAHRSAARAPIIEAAAALVRLGAGEIDAGTPGEPTLHVSPDGPYLLTGDTVVEDHLGVPMSANRPVAFCRCGRSSSKPFCDGSHVEAAFSGDKDAHRVADRRDTYVGQQATVFDNRGLCAHSGFCTDRLNAVFHLGEEPFVTPSGARLDEIMQAVRRCPSGALSYGMDGGEDRAYVDQRRSATVQISKDGPYRITGGVRLVDEDGRPVDRPAGASTEHFSLCRCGASLNKPFCSGMHWSTGFADPVADPAAEPTLFEWAGGYPALLDMTRIFYSRHVPSDPLIGPLFAAMAPDHPERVAAWLSEVFGGPTFYSDRYGGYARMISEHLDKHLTRDQRAHWARLMSQSADEAGLPDDAEFRAAFTGYIEWGSRIAVENSQGGAKPPANMPVPKWWWVCNTRPGARIRADAPVAQPAGPESVAMLADGEAASFERHVRPLFRASDRASMRFAFDLWAHDDVQKHATAILARVRAGTMPCDGAWAEDKVTLLARWLDDGCPP